MKKTIYWIHLNEIGQLLHNGSVPLDAVGENELKLVVTLEEMERYMKEKGIKGKLKLEK